tara:strand:- start:6726 stop:7964 length:1239 start_codon:yes stop_codon:yes gene_type:complete
MAAFADYILTRELQSVDGGLLALTSPTTVISAGTDTGSAAVALGFTFSYDDVDYTSCTVYSDGWLRFAGTWPASQYENNVFDNLSNTSVSLHPWHDDLITQASTGYVRHETLGSAPNRYCVIEWRCYGKYNHNASHNVLLTFQVVLRETTGNIEFRYAPAGADYGVTGSPSYASVSATIGARVSTASAINGNIREFTEEAGTPDANGGVSTTPIKLDCLPQPGNEWPGDSTNGIEGAPFNFHFTATPEEEEEEAVAAPDPDVTSWWFGVDGPAPGTPHTWDPYPEDPEPSLPYLVVATLYTDARADAADVRPGQDRRGWWGDTYQPGAGSLLWTLQPKPITADTAPLAAQMARDALEWLITDGLATDVDVRAEVQQASSGARIALEVTVTRREDGEQVPVLLPDLWSSYRGN